MEIASDAQSLLSEQSQPGVFCGPGQRLCAGTPRPGEPCPQQDHCLDQQERGDIFATVSVDHGSRHDAHGKTRGDCGQGNDSGSAARPGLETRAEGDCQPPDVPGYYPNGHHLGEVAE